MDKFPRCITNGKIDDLDRRRLRGDIARAFEHAPNGNMDAVFKENVIRHMFIMFACLMVRLHHRNAIQFVR